MRPDDIDVAWLNDALAERHPGVRVADVEIVRVDELTNTHVRLRVAYDEPTGAPERMFAKLPPLDPARRESLAASNMGPRESRFYTELAPVVTMRVPAMHAARYDDADRSFVQLLEDLDATGCTVPDGRHGVTRDAAAGALEDLADLHLQFEDPARRKELAGWVPETTPKSSVRRDAPAVRARPPPRPAERRLRRDRRALHQPRRRAPGAVARRPRRPSSTAIPISATCSTTTGEPGSSTGGSSR